MTSTSPFLGTPRVTFFREVAWCLLIWISLLLHYLINRVPYYSWDSDFYLNFIFNNPNQFSLLFRPLTYSYLIKFFAAKSIILAPILQATLTVIMIWLCRYSLDPQLKPFKIWLWWLTPLILFPVSLLMNMIHADAIAGLAILAYFFYWSVDAAKWKLKISALFIFGIMSSSHYSLWGLGLTLLFMQLAIGLMRSFSLKSLTQNSLAIVLFLLTFWSINFLPYRSIEPERVFYLYMYSKLITTTPFLQYEADFCAKASPEVDKRLCKRFEPGNRFDLWDWSPDGLIHQAGGVESTIVATKPHVKRFLASPESKKVVPTLLATSIQQLKSYQLPEVFVKSWPEKLNRMLSYYGLENHKVSAVSRAQPLISISRILNWMTFFILPFVILHLLMKGERLRQLGLQMTFMIFVHSFGIAFIAEPMGRYNSRIYWAFALIALLALMTTHKHIEPKSDTKA